MTAKPHFENLNIVDLDLVPLVLVATTHILEWMCPNNIPLRIFEKHPNFHKRYPKGSFWSGYEHHESTGRKDIKAADEYILSQEKHHNVKVIRDVQRKIFSFAADEDTATPAGVAE